MSIPKEQEIKQTIKLQQKEPILVLAQDLVVKYPDNTIAIRGINFKIVKGQHIAVIGQSGCGKSTLLKALIRFVPLSGELFLAAGDAPQLNVYDWRKNFAYVSQDVQLFGDSILNNLTYWDDNRIIDAKKACKAACIDDFITSLPNGYDTILNEKGDNLSGGQKQRIAIARALSRNPNILLLDEATSALDSTTERKILDNLQKLYPDMTIVSVTHHITNLKFVDCIWVMNNGIIVDKGAHKELMSRCDYYKEYFTSQNDNLQSLRK